MMKQCLSWLHCPSMPMLIIAAIFLGIMPVMPEPHLVQKLRMLIDGTLVKSIDIFDLFWHSWPLFWIALRLLSPGAAGQCKVPKRP